MSKRSSRNVAPVVYTEESDNEEDFEDGENNFLNSMIDNELYPNLFPPLSPLQLQLRSLCRAGDKCEVENFLKNNPEIDLDAKDPEAYTTVLNEVSTKNAQFSDIVELLLQAGAKHDVTDSLGNTPLHNSILYYPSTYQTVHLLLNNGADVSVLNYEGATPLSLAEDKDLKTVLKELKKTGKKNDKTASPVTYNRSPKLMSLILKNEFPKTEVVPVTVHENTVQSKTPGLLKRKREDDDEDQSFEENKKRIRFCPQDSTGADIDAQFSEDEEVMSTECNSNENGEICSNSISEICESTDKILPFKEVDSSQSEQNKSSNEVTAVKILDEEKVHIKENSPSGLISKVQTSIKNYFLPDK